MDGTKGTGKFVLSVPLDDDDDEDEDGGDIYTYIYIFFSYFFFHHTTCERTYDTLSASAVNQGDYIYIYIIALFC